MVNPIIENFNDSPFFHDPLSKCLLHLINPVLGMTLNFIWWWGYSSDNLVSVEYPIIAITLRSTQTQSVAALYRPIYWQKWSVWKLIVFDGTVCKKKSFKTQLHRIIWTYNEYDSLSSRHKITLDELTCC